MTKIINIKSGEKYDVYCGRPGKGQDGYFGNPFLIGVDGSRDEVINKYNIYFLKKIETDSEFKKRVLELNGKTLGCFCVPARCHCEVIVDYLNSHNELEKQINNIKNFKFENRVIIAGSRTITDYNLIKQAIIESNFKIDEVVCGMAKGVDLASKRYAEENNIPIQKSYAKWNDFTVKPCVIKTRYDGIKYNSWAGHNRNKEMAQYGTHLILIWDGKSSGSASMKKLAKEKGLIIYEKVV